MGKYDDISYRLITHIDEAFPFAHMGMPRDWEKIDQMLSCIPPDGERLMNMEDLLNFYD